MKSESMPWDWNTNQKRTTGRWGSGVKQEEEFSPEPRNYLKHIWDGKLRIGAWVQRMVVSSGVPRPPEECITPTKQPTRA